MASAANFLSCDYPDRCVLPNAFMSEQAELVHVNEQISLLDNHISQLTMLRHNLLHRTRQLHNQLLPIHALPLEIMSNIFQQLTDSYDYGYSNFDNYQNCLRQAFVLVSVSSHFRHVALGTPELWNKVALHSKAIQKASYFLRHCIALAPSVNISVYDVLDKERASSTVNILLTPNVMQKVKTFELYESFNAPNHWIDKLKESDCPMLDTLSIRQILAREPLAFDLGTLTTVTRLSIEASCLEHSSVAPPPSLQYLNIHDVPQPALVSLLYQCPNLVECVVDVNTQDDGSGGDTHFTKPLALACLKRLTSTDIDAIMMNQSVENLQLPSLEFLKLEFSRGTKISSIALLCRKVSDTLTTLSFYGIPEEFEYNRLFELLRIPFPSLRELELHSWTWKSFSNIICGLALLESECNGSRPHYFPALKSITLRCIVDINTRSLLNILKECRIGEVFRFHLLLHSIGYHYLWSPELEDELRSIVGSRQIEITWQKE